jgi:hypothetical protein
VRLRCAQRRDHRTGPIAPVFCTGHRVAKDWELVFAEIHVAPRGTSGFFFAGAGVCEELREIGGIVGEAAAGRSDLATNSWNLSDGGSLSGLSTIRTLGTANPGFRAR